MRRRSRIGLPWKAPIIAMARPRGEPRGGRNWQCLHRQEISHATILPSRIDASKSSVGRLGPVTFAAPSV
jgi:hypothetical protein